MLMVQVSANLPIGRQPFDRAIAEMSIRAEKTTLGTFAIYDTVKLILAG